MKKCIAALLAAALLVSGTATANHIRSVIAVDFLTVEVVMADPLTKEELSPRAFDEARPIFEFNEGVEMTGAPVEYEARGYPNTYRIPVNGLDTDVIYKIKYKKQKAKTFKAYEGEEMEKRYRDRYGNYF